MSEKLKGHELHQLFHIGRYQQGIPRADVLDAAPYWWGKRTMPKLAARGFVEPHPVNPTGWRITQAGRDYLAGLFTS